MSLNNFDFYIEFSRGLENLKHEFMQYSLNFIKKYIKLDNMRVDKFYFNFLIYMKIKFVVCGINYLNVYMNHPFILI